MVTPRYLADATLLITVLAILYSEFKGSITQMYEMLRSYRQSCPPCQSVRAHLYHWGCM